MPRTARPNRKLESWQQMVVRVCSCLQKPTIPATLMWNLAQKSSISAHFVTKLFVYFRGVAAKDLVTDGKQHTHKKDWIEKQAVAVHQPELTCQVFGLFQLLFPVFTSIPFCQVTVWKSCSEWWVRECTVNECMGMPDPLFCTLPMCTSVFSNLLPGCITLNATCRKKQLKIRNTQWDGSGDV